MGKGGRFGKYGEGKRFERLRQKKERLLEITKDAWKIKKRSPRRPGSRIIDGR